MSTVTVWVFWYVLGRSHFTRALSTSYYPPVSILKIESNASRPSNWCLPFRPCILHTAYCILPVVNTYQFSAVALGMDCLHMPWRQNKKKKKKTTLWEGDPWNGRPCERVHGPPGSPASAGRAVARFPLMRLLCQHRFAERNFKTVTAVGWQPARALVY